jgi:spore germination protein KB
MELIRFFMPNTPPVLINLLFTLLVIYTMIRGFEGYARVTELYSFFLVSIIGITLFLVLTSADLKNIQPVLSQGPMPVFKSLGTLYPYAMETVLFMSLWLPCLNQGKKAKRAVLWGLPVSGILISILVLVNICVFGLQLTQSRVFPALGIFRYINIPNFLLGFDVLFMILWIASSYLEILVFFYQPVVGLAQWLNLKDYKPLVIPMAVLNAVLAMVPSNIVEVIRLDSLKNPVIILPMALLIPVVWLVALMRKSGKAAPV